MEAEISAETISSHVQNFMKSSSAEFSESNRWRNCVLSNSNNAFQLINLLVSHPMDTNSQLFVLDLISTLLETYHQKYPLHELQSILCRTTESFLSNSVIQKRLAEVISLIIQQIYISEHTFEDPADSLVSLTPLQASIYVETLSIMGRNGDDSDFGQTHILPLFFLGLRLLQTQPEFAIPIIKASIMFKYSFEMTYHLILVPQILESFDVAAIQSIYSIASQSIPPLSSDAVLIMAALSRVSRPPEPISTGIINFVSSLLSSVDFSRNEQNATSLQILLSSIERLDDSNFATQLISYERALLSESYATAFSLLPSVVSLLKRASTSRSFQFSSTSVHLLILDFISHSVEEPTLAEVVLSDPHTASQVIYGLWHMSSYQSADIYNLINDLLKQASDRAIAFLLLVIRVIMKNPLSFLGIKMPSSKDEEPKNAKLLSLAFSAIKNLSSEKSEIERFTMSFMKTFVKVALKTSIPKYNLSDVFNSPPELADFIFAREWKNLLIDNGEYAFKAVSAFVNTKGAISLLYSTDWPEKLFSSYLALPCKSNVLCILAKVLTQNEEMKKKFLGQMKSDFSGNIDTSTIARLLKYLNGLFLSSQNQLEWQEYFIFFWNNFSQYCIQDGYCENIKPFVQFAYKLIQKAPNSNPFQTHTPYSFRMFQFFVKLLTNLTITISPRLNEVEVDTDIFKSAFDVSDLYDAHPIGLDEAHEIGLDKRQVQLRTSKDLQIDPGTKDEDWLMLSRIISSAQTLLQSPFPNYGILEFYDDKCVFDLFDAVIAAASKTPMLTLLSMPALIFELSALISKMTEYFRNVVLQNPVFYHFLINFTKISFLSHLTDVIKNTCLTLLIILQCFNDKEQITELMPHYVLTLNVALSQSDCIFAVELIFEYARIDYNFILEIEEEIESSIDDSSLQNGFREAFKAIWTTDVQVSNQEEYNRAIVDNFNRFRSQVSQMHLKLYSIPSLEKYFLFK